MARFQSPSGTPLGANATFMVKMEGKGWITLERFVTYFAKGKGKELKRDFARASRYYLKAYQQVLWRGLLSEGAYIGIEWEPHSEEYSQSSGRLLFRDGIYQKAIENMVIIQKHYNTGIYMRAADQAAKSVGGKTVGEYAMIHEKGSIVRQIPARPLWYPAFVRMETGTHRKGNRGTTRGFESKVRGAIGNRLKLMGIEVKMVIH